MFRMTVETAKIPGGPQIQGENQLIFNLGEGIVEGEGGDGGRTMGVVVGSGFFFACGLSPIWVAGMFLVGVVFTKEGHSI